MATEVEKEKGANTMSQSKDFRVLTSEISGDFYVLDADHNTRCIVPIHVPQAAKVADFIAIALWTREVTPKKGCVMTENEKQFERWKSAVEVAMRELQVAVDEALREAAEARRHEKIACADRDALMKSVLQLREKNDALMAQARRNSCEIAELKQSMGGVYLRGAD